MNHRRVVALLAAFAVAGTLVFPSGAVPLFSGPTDDVGEDVELAPSSDYAYLEDGELVVDVSAANPDLEGEGVNDDAVTDIGEVFRVRYNGSQYADVWLTHESDAVTFRVDGEPVESEANNVTLAPNESVAVTVAVDTRGETADGLLDDVTVHAKVTEPESVEPQQAGESSIEFGGPSVQVRAPTESSRTFTVVGGAPDRTYQFDASALALDRAGDAALTLDEVAVGSAEGSLSMGIEAVRGESSRSLVAADGAEPLGAARVTVETGAVSNATLRFSVPQSYLDAHDATLEDLAVYRADNGELSELDVTLTGERDGRLRFEAETAGFSTLVVAADRARLAVTDASLNRTAVEPGAPVAVSATVSNDGSVAGERTVPVTVDGEVVAERTVSVPAGESVTVTASVARDDAGEYAVAVDGVSAGAFAVEAASEQVDESSVESTEQPSDNAESTAEPPATDTLEQAAGFGLADLVGLVVLLGIVALTLFLARRTPWR